MQHASEVTSPNSSANLLILAFFTISSSSSISVTVFSVNWFIPLEYKFLISSSEYSQRSTLPSPVQYKGRFLPIEDINFIGREHSTFVK